MDVPNSHSDFANFENFSNFNENTTEERFSFETKNDKNEFNNELNLSQKEEFVTLQGILYKLKKKKYSTKNF